MPKCANFDDLYRLSTDEFNLITSPKKGFLGSHFSIRILATTTSRSMKVIVNQDRFLYN